MIESWNQETNSLKRKGASCYINDQHWNNKNGFLPHSHRSDHPLLLCDWQYLCLGLCGNLWRPLHAWKHHRDQPSGENCCEFWMFWQFSVSRISSILWLQWLGGPCLSPFGNHRRGYVYTLHLIMDGSTNFMNPSYKCHEMIVLKWSPFKGWDG